MAYDVISFENANDGRIKKAPVGFSWTALFFGCWVPLLRGDWKYFFIMLVAAMFTIGLSQLVFCFLYNKWYIEKLVESGFKVDSVKKGSIEDISSKIGIKLKVIEKK
jgi:hypothetical protein